MTRPGLNVRGVTKSYGALHVLAGVELAVPAGAIAAVLGPSGSGKTTLLRVVAGFERPDSGAVEIGGTVVDDVRCHVAVERRRIGYVPQEGGLFPHLDVRANVAFGVRARRSSRARRVDDLLELVGLEGYGGRFPHQLSGGQQQRVAIARALAPEPSLVLLDEPFASLDANLRAQVRAEVCAVLRRAGTTAVLVTHDQDEALSVADVVAVLRAGAIAQADAPMTLYAHPVDADVARFVGDANLVEGVAAGRGVETPLGTLETYSAPAAPGGAVTTLIRPEQLVVTTGTWPSSPGAGAPARVTGVEYHGHDTTVRLVPLAPGLPATMVARVVGTMPLDNETVVHVRVRGPVEAWGLTRSPGR